MGRVSQRIVVNVLLTTAVVVGLVAAAGPGKAVAATSVRVAFPVAAKTTDSLWSGGTLSVAVERRSWGRIQATVSGTLRTTKPGPVAGLHLRLESCDAYPGDILATPENAPPVTPNIILDGGGAGAWLDVPLRNHNRRVSVRATALLNSHNTEWPNPPKPESLKWVDCVFVHVSRTLTGGRGDFDDAFGGYKVGGAVAFLSVTVADGRHIDCGIGAWCPTQRLDKSNAE